MHRYATPVLCQGHLGYLAQYGHPFSRGGGAVSDEDSDQSEPLTLSRPLPDIRRLLHIDGRRHELPVLIIGSAAPEAIRPGLQAPYDSRMQSILHAGQRGREARNRLTRTVLGGGVEGPQPGDPMWTISFGAAVDERSEPTDVAVSSALAREHSLGGLPRPTPEPKCPGPGASPALALYSRQGGLDALRPEPMCCRLRTPRAPLWRRSPRATRAAGSGGARDARLASPTQRFGVASTSCQTFIRPPGDRHRPWRNTERSHGQLQAPSPEERALRLSHLPFAQGKWRAA